MKLRRSFLMVCILVGLMIQVSYAQSVKIGVVGPLTGPVAVGGIQTKNGLELAKDEINEKGGIPGVGKIELVYEDDKCVPTDSVNAVTKLVHRDKVLAVIGSVCSSATMASMVVTEKAETPQITTISSSPQITQQGNKWIFRTQISDSTRAAVLAEYAIKVLKKQNIGIVHDADDYGKDGADAFVAKLKDFNVSPKVRESFNRKDKDFSGQLSKMSRAGVDLLVVWGLPEESSLIARQVKDMNLNVQLMGGDPLSNPRFIELAGPAGEGAFSATSFVRTDKSPKAQEFVKKYEARFKIPANNICALGYECLYMLTQAIKDSGPNRSKLKDGIRKMRFESISGTPVTFDENGGSLQKPIVVTIRNGELYRVD
jgi:branched-chain amino acid transport system substrate-binding protein